MKRISVLFTLAAASVLLLTALLPLAAQHRIVRLTRYEGQPITGVRASSAFDVYLVQSDETKVVAELSEAFEEWLDLSLEPDGIVRVSLRSPGGRSVSIRNSILKLTVYLPTITYLSGSGAADFRATGSFESQRTTIDLRGASELESLNLRTGILKIDCTGASEIDLSGRADELEGRITGASDAELALDCGTVRVELSGASDLDLRGKAEMATFSVSGASELDAREFAVKRLTVNANAASSVSVWAIDELRAAASSAAGIRYRGNPRVIDNRSSSAGSVRRVD